MHFNDFFLRFNIIYVIRLTADDCSDWQKFSGEWQGKSASGEANWLSNPQYSLTSEYDDNKIVVCLSQPDQRSGIVSSPYSLRRMSHFSLDPFLLMYPSRSQLP